MAVKDGKYIIVKDIPINGGKSVIPVNTEVTVVQGTVYTNVAVVSPDYQEDFKQLIETDVEHKYVRPHNDIDWDAKYFPV